jgi:hypothetical protein
VNRSLSKKFSFLDDITNVLATKSLSTAKHRGPQWPLLELVLFEWQQRIEAKGGQTSGEILIEKASEIWRQTPEYRDKPVPHFSVGWLSRFKKRHGIRQRITHGESGSVPLAAHEEMRALQTICGEFEEDNIFNMDETGLYWRMSPSSGLSTTSIRGVKRDKARITLVFGCNATGSEKLPLWVLGTAKQPRALKNVNLKALDIIYDSNRKGWMNTTIMKRWLREFYAHIGRNRRVLLLMDNLTSHLLAVEQEPPPHENIHIRFLPKNSTSIYQPLDQGIIKNAKVYYKKQWLQFLINHFENGLNPYSEMTLLHAVRWISSSWKMNVTTTTIYSCFRKSTVIKDAIPLAIHPPPNLEQLFQRLEVASNVRNTMDLANFLNPVDEDIDEDSQASDDIQQILESHLQAEDQEEEEEIDEPLPPPPPSASHALSAIQLVQSFLEYQEDSTASEMSAIRRLEGKFSLLQLDSLQQRTLDRWLM